MDHRQPADDIILHVCMRCRGGQETSATTERGGARLARAILAARAARHDLPPHAVHGVHCMSQCKRPCTVALTAPGRFTYLFGDLQPDRDAEAVVALLPLYAAAADGFLPRDQRPRAMQAGILGRIPPLGAASDLVEPLHTPDQRNDRR